MKFINPLSILYLNITQDLQLRQKIYSRILGSLSRDLSSRAVTKLNSRQDQYPEYKYQLSDEVVLVRRPYFLSTVGNYLNLVVGNTILLISNTGSGLYARMCHYL